MRALPIVTLLLMLGAHEAYAGGFDTKTMLENFSMKEVERPLLVGRGWLQLDLGIDVKQARGYWDAEGQAQDFQYATWTYTTESLGLRYGIARRGEVTMGVPFHFVRLTNDKLGTDTRDFGLGDPTFGYKYELFRSYAPMTNVVAFARYKGAAGQESPASILGGPNDFKSFVMTTGTPDLDLGLHAKRQVGPAALQARAGYIRRFSGLAMYISEVNTNQFNGRIKPGDIEYAEVGAMVQVGMFALGADYMIQHRELTRLGTTSEGFFPNKHLKEVPDSDGVASDLKVTALANVTRHLDAALAATVPLSGEDFLFFPIEDLSPTRGVTFGGLLKLRY
jgi:hypothetical protein